MVDAAAVAAVLEPLTEELGRPSFVWVHLVDPRAPYREVAPWAEAFDVELASRVPEVRQAPQDVRRLQRQRASAAGLTPLLRGVDNPVLLETLEVLYDSEKSARSTGGSSRWWGRSSSAGTT